MTYKETHWSVWSQELQLLNEKCALETKFSDLRMVRYSLHNFTVSLHWFFVLLKRIDKCSHYAWTDVTSFWVAGNWWEAKWIHHFCLKWIGSQKRWPWRKFKADSWFKGETWHLFLKIKYIPPYNIWHVCHGYVGLNC